MIYEPREDSYLLQKVLIDYLSKLKNKNISILDMGSGSGIQAQTCRDLGFKNILTADINKEAVNHLKQQGFQSIHSNLFKTIKKSKNEYEKFDLIIFNPPYLPLDKREPKDSRLATTGGKKGCEIIIRFLEQAKSYLPSKGIILLLISSLSKPEIIKQYLKRYNYHAQELSNQKLFFEQLYILKIKNKTN
ncbi:MAG: HemK2/MTQ2 family protein methyltransferase [Candidatus Pacearchaeota archaeon]